MKLKEKQNKKIKKNNFIFDKSKFNFKNVSVRSNKYTKYFIKGKLI